MIAAMPGDSLLIRLCGHKEALSDSSVFCSSDKDARLVLPPFSALVDLFDCSLMTGSPPDGDTRF